MIIRRKHTTNFTTIGNGHGSGTDASFARRQPARQRQATVHSDLCPFSRLSTATFKGGA
jgi:hypothetical protein